MKHDAKTTMLELSEQEFRMWQHSTITAAFLQFMDDQIAAFREIGMDLLEAGAFRQNDPHEDRNPDVVRGKLLALKELRQISLDRIQGFYLDQQRAEDSQEEPQP